MPLEIRTLGIVLARRDYREADRLLTVLTPELGLIVAVARGVRRPRSRLAASLEPFRICNLRLVRGAGELFTVAGALRQAQDRPLLQVENNLPLPILAQFFAAAELTVRLLPPEKPAESVWQIWLEFLAVAGDPPAWLAVAVPARLLAALGYLPESFADVRLAKLLRFLAGNSFAAARRLTFEPALAAAAAAELNQLAAAAAERPLRVPAATAGW